MTLPLAKAHKRQDTTEPELATGPEPTTEPEPATAKPRRRRGTRTRARFFAWDEAFADPAAIESDYHRMERRQRERSGRSAWQR